MYKIIACDLDETLLNSDTHVSLINRNAIQKARKLGVKFVLATGRGYKSVQNTLEELNLKGQPGEYVISFNGASITENKGNKSLYFNGLSYDLANYLYRHGAN